MIGLALGAAIIMPVTAQAQDRGGERSTSWQRGGQDRGAMVNGDARREAIQQAREANRAVERPSRPVERPSPTVTPPATRSPPAATGGSPGRQWQRGGGDREAADTQRNWNRGGQPPRDESRAGHNDRPDRAGRTERDGRDLAGRDRDRNGRDRDWGRDRNDGRNNERWSSDRRDWDRDGRDGRNWNRNWTTDRNRWTDNRRDRWDRDWRNDRRYDWRDYRKHNRSAYRLPRYVAPRGGYSYRRWSPGYRWDPWFYSSSYWISDPWYYRLPPAYGGYRWVRYYDDAVLVDIRNGEIIDIIYSFFF